MHDNYNEQIKVTASSEMKGDNYERARNIENVLRNAVLSKNPDITLAELQKGIESSLKMGGIIGATDIKVERKGPEENPNQLVTVSGKIPGDDTGPISFYHEFN